MIYIISTKYTQLIFSLVVDNLLKDAVYCINIYIPYNNEDEYFLYTSSYDGTNLQTIGNYGFILCRHGMQNQLKEKIGMLLSDSAGCET